MAGIAAGKVMMTDYHDGAFWRPAGFHTDSSQPHVSTLIAFFNLGLLSSRLSIHWRLGGLILLSALWGYFSSFYFPGNSMGGLHVVPNKKAWVGSEIVWITTESKADASASSVLSYIDGWGQF